MPCSRVSGINATAITAGDSHTCALRSDGQVVCWGMNDFGQLGIGNRSNVGTGQWQMGSNLTSVDLGTGAADHSITNTLHDEIT